MIYVIGSEGTAAVKIGLANDPAKRVGSLQTGTPHTLSLLWTHGGGAELEMHLHATFIEHRVRGEWFDLTPLGDPVTVIRDVVRNAGDKLLSVPRRFRYDSAVRISSPHVSPYVPARVVVMHRVCPNCEGPLCPGRMNAGGACEHR